jgi:uncharacterized membrane protein HdeD (DUF308 family)
VRVLSIILGVLLIVGGLMSIVNPGVMVLSLGSLMGLFILVHGVGSLINHYRFRFVSEGWGIAGAILSILLGALLLTSTSLQWISNIAIVFAVGLWIMAAGVVCMATAFKLAGTGRKTLWEKPSLGWLWLLFLGAGMMILGVLAFIHPIKGVLTMNVLLGVYVMVSGIHLIATSCCHPEY